MLAPRLMLLLLVPVATAAAHSKDAERWAEVSHAALYTNGKKIKKWKCRSPDLPTSVRGVYEKREQRDRSCCFLSPVGPHSSLLTFFSLCLRRRRVRL